MRHDEYVTGVLAFRLVMAIAQGRKDDIGSVLAQIPQTGAAAAASRRELKTN